MYYSSMSEASAAAGGTGSVVSVSTGISSYTSVTGSQSYPYYSTVTGRYYSNYNVALAAGGGISGNVSVRY